MLDTGHSVLGSLLARAAAVIMIEEASIICLVVSLEREVLCLIQQILTTEASVL